MFSTFTTEGYIIIHCVSGSLCKGSKLWQLSTCSVIALLKYIQVFENSMTGRAYIGEVLIHIWLKSMKK